MTPRVSVIIPIHNAAAWLATCLDSILAQSFQEFEIVCIDDASKDASLSILESYAAKDKRISVFAFSQNQGSGPARNRGIDEAKGEYLIFCDADDVYTPNALSLLYQRITETGAPIGGGNLAFMDHALKSFTGISSTVASTQFCENALVSPQEYPPLWLPIYHPRYMITADLLRNNNIRYPNLLRGQDPPFLAHVFCHAGQVAVCPEVVYIVRAAEAGKSKLADPQTFIDHVAHFRMGYEVFLEHGERDLAIFYLGQALAGILQLHAFLRFSREQRRLLLAALLPLADSIGEDLFQERYFPYPVKGEQLKRDVALVTTGTYKFILAKIMERLRKELKL